MGRRVNPWKIIKSEKKGPKTPTTVVMGETEVMLQGKTRRLTATHRTWMGSNVETLTKPTQPTLGRLKEMISKEKQIIRTRKYWGETMRKPKGTQGKWGRCH